MNIISLISGMITVITSTKNLRVKRLMALQKSNERKKSGLFVIEGTRETALALAAGYEIKAIFYCPELLQPAEIDKIRSQIPYVVEMFEVERNVFNALVYRQESGGIIVIAMQRELLLDNLKISGNPLIVVLEKVEKPGNLGAVLRTSDAAAVDAVIICDPQTDVYNPNVVRSSIGCLFTNQVAVADSMTTIGWLKAHGVAIYSTTLEGAVFYHQVDYSHPSAIVMGTEATGLTDLWIKHADAGIKIPMLGKIDSMNVSTAAAVIIYEARKQRGFI
jgi:TrmH family RNA methyltransferase